MRASRPTGPESYAGSILLAHPELSDPNFRRTVVLMTTHGTDGAMGVVLNRPLHKRLGELGGDFALGPLTGVPLFHGGPVQTEQLIIAAWRTHSSGFQLHLGIDPDKAIQFLGDDGMHVQAYFGHSGWSASSWKTGSPRTPGSWPYRPRSLYPAPGCGALAAGPYPARATEWRYPGRRARRRPGRTDAFPGRLGVEQIPPSSSAPIVPVEGRFRPSNLPRSVCGLPEVVRRKGQDLRHQQDRPPLSRRVWADPLFP